MNNELLRDFNREEVSYALNQMHPNKAPGPDGFGVGFFQRYWSIVGCDVTNVVLDFLNSDSPCPRLNYTHVVLIPKVQNPENLSQFCPISLCNVVYKLIAKVLANRLKKVLPSIVSKF